MTLFEITYTALKNNGYSQKSASHYAAQYCRFKAASVAAKDTELYHAWKKEPTSENLSALLTQLDPIITSEANKWKQTLINPALLKSKATTLTYDALKSYNPEKSQLNTHVINYLKKMNRFVIENQQAVRVPEEKIFEYRGFMKKKEELTQELNRDVTNEDFQKKFGKGVKISDYKPIIENFYSMQGETGGAPAMEELSNDIVGIRMAYSTMTPTQQKVFRHSYGYEKTPVMSSKAIASMLKISPAAVSKHNRLINKKLKQHIAATREVLSA